MPVYVMHCPGCDRLIERSLSYAEFDACREMGYPSFCTESMEDELLTPMIAGAPPVHFKGYGFYSTDNASSNEKYARDHFDGSGANPELKAMQRRIKDPASTAPKGKSS